MTLYQITTGGCGESYVRCYVWAKSEDRARFLFKEKYPNERLHNCCKLFESTSKTFVTELSDDGFVYTGFVATENDQ